MKFNNPQSKCLAFDYNYIIVYPSHCIVTEK